MEPIGDIPRCILKQASDLASGQYPFNDSEDEYHRMSDLYGYFSDEMPPEYDLEGMAFSSRNDRSSGSCRFSQQPLLVLTRYSEQFMNWLSHLGEPRDLSILQDMPAQQDGSPPPEIVPKWEAPTHEQEPEAIGQIERTNGTEDERRNLLIQECTDLMNELDTFHTKADENNRQLIEHTLSRLENALDRTGVERIENESRFDIVRHRADFGKRIPQGAPISETIRPGYLLKNRVIRRALVKVDTVQS
jgi:hypothetical protein